MADPYPVTLDTKNFTLDDSGALNVVATNNPITASNHNLIQSAIVELEVKVGIDGSSAVTSLDYLLKSTLSGDPGHLHTKVGTIATGTWNGTAIADGYGGTGQTTYAAGDILYASGVDTLTKLAAGTDTHVLTLASGLPSWAAASSSSDFTDLVTITVTDSDPALTIEQSGTGKIADLKGDGTSRFSLDDDGIVNAKAVDLKSETGFNIEGTRDLDGGDTIAFLRVGEGATNLFRVGLYGSYKIDMFADLYMSGKQISNSPHWLISNSGLKIWKSPASDAFEILRGADGDSMTLDLGGATKSWLEVKDGLLKETSGDETMFDFSGTVDKAEGNYTAFKMNVTENTAEGTANLLLDLQVGGSTVFNISDTGVFAINSSDPALTISQSGAGDILDLQDGGNSAFTVDEHGAIYSYPQVGSTAMVVQGYGTDSYDIFKILDSPLPDYGGNTLFSVSQAGVNETHLNTMKVFVKRNLIIESGTGSIFFTDGWTNGIAIYAKTYDGSNNSAVMELDHENNGQGRFAIVDGSEAAMIEFTGRTGVGYTPEIEVHQLIRSEDDNPLVDDALGQMQGLVTATKTINHDTTTATMITIPAGSIIRKCYFRVGATAFDGTFTVDFGNGTTADGYLATAKITEGTTGLYGINEDDRGALLWDGTLQVGDYSASAITVVATIDGGGASEGSGVLYIQYERVH